MTFAWRVVRNALSATSVGRRLLYPPQRLATAFGSSDASYAWSVYAEAHRRLLAVGFRRANRILEVGPGRNLGTALLWWATAEASRPPESLPVMVLAWDIYPNVSPSKEFLRELAKQLLETRPTSSPVGEKAIGLIRHVATGTTSPNLEYLVSPLKGLQARLDGEGFDLVYSQAALEHVWEIADAWRVLAEATNQEGWHYHTIDLADHGRRDTDPFQMLEWSETAYWLTGRFTPGAINRWRATEHITLLQSLGFRIVTDERKRAPQFVLDTTRFAKRFRRMGEKEIATTMLRLVAQKSGSSND